MTGGAEQVDAVVFDHGRVHQCVDILLANTSLGEHLLHTEHLGTGGRVIHEYTPGALPVTAWSSGEQALWSLLGSVTGRGQVNLYELAARFVGAPEAGYIAGIVTALFTGKRL